MEPNTGNSASAAGPKKDKKSKKNYEDGDGKKKFVSISQVLHLTTKYRWLHVLLLLLMFQVKATQKTATVPVISL